MLNTKFPTLESILTSLDDQIAAVQDSNASIDRELTESNKVRDQVLLKRAEALKTNLPGIFQSAAASTAEISQLPEAVRPLAEETRAQVQQLAQAKEFAATLRQIDALTERFKNTNELEKKAELYQKIRPLVHDIGTGSFGSARDALWNELQDAVAPAKQQALENLGKALGADWPNENPVTLEFTESFRIALMLDDNDFDGAIDAFNVLCNALDIRFKFNFESEQKTRRFDKPEWLFYFFGKMIDPHLKWLKTTVQPIVSEIFPEVLAVNAFTSALLPSVFRAAKLYLDVCKQDPEMLSHFLQESFKFDQDLVEKYYYYFSDDWLGITTTSLVNDEKAFQQWLQYEIDATDVAFTELSENAAAWNIDYDSADTKITSRPTILGLGFSTLFDSVTEMFKNLKLPKLQLMFLNDIQLTLIDRYVAFLKRRKNHPQADLDDYGKVIGSLGYFVDFLSHRNSHLTFIDLQTNIGAEDALFDEVIQSLNSFRTACLEEINTMLRRALRELFKAYTHKNDHSTEEPSQSLHSPIPKLIARLDYFKNICNVVDYTIIRANLSEAVGSYLFKSVVQAGSFNSDRGRSLELDVEYIWNSLGLIKNEEYRNLIASASYFQTGTTPESLSPEIFSSIQRRRA